MVRGRSHWPAFSRSPDSIDGGDGQPQPVLLNQRRLHFPLHPIVEKRRVGVGAHRANHQHMLRTQSFAGQRGINHQRVVSMDEGLFAPGLPARRSRATEDDIHRVNHLRRGIGQLGIVRIKDTFRWRQRATRRRGDGAYTGSSLQQPE